MKRALVTLALAMAPFATVAIPPAIQLLLFRPKVQQPREQSKPSQHTPTQLPRAGKPASAAQPKEKTK